MGNSPIEISAKGILLEISIDLPKFELLLIKKTVFFWLFMAFAFSDLSTRLRFLVPATGRCQTFIITLTIHLTSQLSANTARGPITPSHVNQNPFVNCRGDAILSKELCEVLKKPSWAAYPTVRRWPSRNTQSLRLLYPKKMSHCLR